MHLSNWSVILRIAIFIKPSFLAAGLCREELITSPLVLDHRWHLLMVQVEM